MKKILTTIAFSIITAAAIAIPSVIPIGPLQCKLVAITQDQPFTLTSNKTNTTATATNTTTVSKATIKKTSFGTADLLSLIENSFNTNFPAGSQVAAIVTDIVIVDSTGTNVIFDPTSVISMTGGTSAQSGLLTEILTSSKNGESVAGNYIRNFFGAGTLSYDDSLQMTRDATHSQFRLQGMFTVSEVNNLKTHVTKFNMELQGTAEGTIRNVPTVLTGTIKSKSNGGLARP